MKSIWKQDTPITARKSLQNDMSIQVVVIGAGMAGILTAFFLQKKGLQVIVLEADRIGSGQTQNTTAKITSQHGLFYADAVYKIGKKRTAAYAQANENAIDEFEKIVKDEGIDCDFKRLSSYIYTTQKENKKKLKREAKTAAGFGINAEYVEGTQITELPFPVAGAVCFKNQAQFHPLVFLRHLADELTIYEHTKVLSVKGHTVYTESNRIEADYIVFATHYPFLNLPGFYFLRQHQERSYCLALRKQKELSGMYYSMDENGLSLRSEGEYLLLGGGSHRTGKKITCQDKEYGYAFLKEAAKKLYTGAETAFAWSAQDCMPHDDIPYIGKYSVFFPYWFVASGFKKWGMTSSMIAAKIISTRIYEDSVKEYSEKKDKEISKYEYVFSPQRFLPVAAAKKLVIDIMESICGLTKGLFSKSEQRCPHMGCKVEWNPQENSWDCPCHGSRFSYEGELKDNPAQTNLK